MSLTRLQALEELLRGWLDFHPWPNGSVAFQGGGGPAPSSLVPCSDCDGTGRLRAGVRCSSCTGRGVVSVDAYTGRTVADASTGWAELLDTWAVCSRCAGGDRDCSRCHGTGKEAALISGKVRAELDGAPARVRQGDRVLDALDDGERLRQLSEAGRLLAEGMRELRRVDPAGHTVIVWTLVLGHVPVRSLSERERAVLVVGMVRLSRLVPGRVLVPADLVRAARARRLADAGRVGASRRLHGSARARRDEAIRDLYALGSWSQEALAVRFGVDQSTVSRAVRVRDEEGVAV